MNEFLSHAISPIILIYVVSGMLALGLGHTVRQILGPLRNIRITISAVVASYIILPLIAALVSRFFGFDPSIRYGLVLIAMCAGAEIGPVLTAASNGNVRLSGAILVVSIAITIIYLPLMLGVFLPDVKIDVGKLVLKLCLTIVAPLLIGLFIRSRSEKIAHAIEKYMHMISRVFVILLTFAILFVYYKQLIALLGSYVILAGFISVVGGFLIGYVLGLPDRGTALAMGYMHGTRNASMSVMVASMVFKDKPNVMLAIVVVVILILVIWLPVSRLCRIKPAPVAKLG